MLDYSTIKKIARRGKRGAMQCVFGCDLKPCGFDLIQGDLRLHIGDSEHLCIVL